MTLDECIIAWNFRRTLHFASEVEYSVEVIAVSNRNNFSGVTGSKPGQVSLEDFWAHTLVSIKKQFIWLII